MIINRDALLEVCSKLLPIAKTGIDGGIVFMEDDIVGFNQHLLIAIPFKTGILGGAPTQDLVAILKKMRPGEIQLEADSEQITVNSSDLRLSLKYDHDDYRIESIENLLHTVDACDEWFGFESYASFANALDLCQQNAANIFYSALNYVGLFENTMMGGNDFVISRYHSPEYFETRVLLDVQQCKEIVKYDFNQYACNEDYMTFSAPDGSVIIAANHQHIFADEKYPDIDSFFDFPGHKVNLPEDLSEHINRVQSMAVGKSKIERMVMITLCAGSIKIRAEKEVGIAEVFCEAPNLKVKGELSFVINPLYFSKALKVSDHIAILGETCIKLKQGAFSTLLSIHRM